MIEVIVGYEPSLPIDLDEEGVEIDSSKIPCWAEIGEVESHSVHDLPLGVEVEI